MHFGSPLPSVLTAAGLLLCLLAVAFSACALPVCEVELAPAFGDGHDVVGFVDSACASWSVDLAVVVACLDGAFPRDLL